jgi:hypothetical protein
MSTSTLPKQPRSRWAALKGKATPFLFLLIAIIAEILAVLYAMSLGIKDEALLESSFKFPGTDWTFTIAISPLFHIIPIAVIISLVATWTYLSRNIILRPQMPTRGKTGPTFKQMKKSRIDRFFNRIGSALTENRVSTYLTQKIRLLKPSARGTIMVVVIFLLFTFVASLLAYPDSIYLTTINAYQTNPSLVDFVRGTSNAFASVGEVVSPINNAVLAASPGFGSFASSVGEIISPVAELDNAGKYLVIQNVATWLSGLLALLYVEFRGQRYRAKRK